MPYLYMLQPVEYINTNCYKIGLSSKCDLNRLKSYGCGSRYIQYFECYKFQEAEKELINNLNNEPNVALFKGKEYFCGNKKVISDVFIQIMLKYANDDEEEIDKDIVNEAEEEIRRKLYNKIKEELEFKFANSKSKKIINYYECKLCLLKTNHLNDFRKHLITKNHINKCKETISCLKCLKSFKNNGTLNRHSNACKKELCPQKISKNKNTESESAVTAGTP